MSIPAALTTAFFHGIGADWPMVGPRIAEAALGWRPQLPNPPQSTRSESTGGAAIKSFLLATAKSDLIESTVFAQMFACGAFLLPTVFKTMRAAPLVVGAVIAGKLLAGYQHRGDYAQQPHTWAEVGNALAGAGLNLALELGSALVIAKFAGVTGQVGNRLLGRIALRAAPLGHHLGMSLGFHMAHTVQRYIAEPTQKDFLHGCLLPMVIDWRSMGKGLAYTALHGVAAGQAMNAPFLQSKFLQPIQRHFIAWNLANFAGTASSHTLDLGLYLFGVDDGRFAQLLAPGLSRLQQAAVLLDDLAVQYCLNTRSDVLLRGGRQAVNRILPAIDHTFWREQSDFYRTLLAEKNFLAGKATPLTFQEAHRRLCANPNDTAASRAFLHAVQRIVEHTPANVSIADALGAALPLHLRLNPILSRIPDELFGKDTIIAMDGPAASGKGSAVKAMQACGLIPSLEGVLPTGSIYRVNTIHVIDHLKTAGYTDIKQVLTQLAPHKQALVDRGFDRLPADIRPLAELVHRALDGLSSDQIARRVVKGRERFYLNGVDVTHRLQIDETSTLNSSVIAALHRSRDIVEEITFQREALRLPGRKIIEGRDVVPLVVGKYALAERLSRKGKHSTVYNVYLEVSAWERALRNLHDPSRGYGQMHFVKMNTNLNSAQGRIKRFPGLPERIQAILGEKLSSYINQNGRDAYAALRAKLVLHEVMERDEADYTKDRGRLYRFADAQHAESGYHLPLLADGLSPQNVAHRIAMGVVDARWGNHRVSEARAEAM